MMKAIPKSLQVPVLAAASLLTSSCSIDLGSLFQPSPLVETLVEGSRGLKLPLIDIEGVISEAPPANAAGVPYPSMVSRVRGSLDVAAEDSENHSLLLRIRSPEGTISASEIVYHEIQSRKRERERPVVAYFQGLAASGGYYVAMPADKIVASPASVTGSIGVIMTSINLSGLMERFGIEDQTFTSGPYKDSPSLLRPMKPEERRHLQDVINRLHGRFEAVVREGRAEIAEQVAGLADGRIFTADEALKLGLVDAVGHLETAIERLKGRAGIPESRLVSYQRVGEYRSGSYVGRHRPRSSTSRSSGSPSRASITSGRRFRVRAQ